MSAPRVFQLGLRRAAAPAMNFQPAGRMVQRRMAQTGNVSQAEGNEILAKQRVNRPVSPHLTIYRPQVTWYPSMLNRITGVALSGGLYLFGLAYLIAPATGWHLESQSLVSSFAALPVAAKVAAKFTVALPFTFHSLNGLRHLSWDVGLGFANKTVIKTGWTVIGLSVVSALYLATAA